MSKPQNIERVEITWDDPWLVISDEDGEFARVDGEAAAMLPYLRDLIYGSGTLKPSGLIPESVASPPKSERKRR